MAIYAFDGTWNGDKVAVEKRTNVWRFTQVHVAENGDSKPFYVTGVGTKFGTVGRVVGGIVGGGAKRRLRQAYRRLYDNVVKHGDTTVDIVGFSRGAAMAVHFANVIADYGVQKPTRRWWRRDKVLGWGIGLDASSERIDVDVRFLAVFDIVASFGVAIGRFQRLNPGFKLNLPTKPVVRHGAHAMALDERRGAFRNERLAVHGDCSRDVRSDTMREVWFRGTHAAVGGSRTLGDVPFCWMVRQARDAGVKIDIGGLANPPRPDPNGRLGTNINPRPKDRQLCKGDWVHAAVKDWTDGGGQTKKGGGWFSFLQSKEKPRPVPWDDAALGLRADDAPFDCA